MSVRNPGYWPSPWPGEDGGPARLQDVLDHDLTFSGPDVHVTFREGVATTMAVLREPDEVFVLRHVPGPDAVSWVERIDPRSLEVLERSADLPGGPTWPGGIAAHENGSLYVVFGRHAHRLDASLQLIASCTLPRNRPYNSFVILPDGSLVTKDFGGVLPGTDPATHVYEPTELVVLDPEHLEVVARCELSEASIARLAADGDAVYVVGVTTLWRVRWDGTALDVDPDFAPRYCTVSGQTYGWDPVIALGAAWFLDNGFGSERYVGTFLGQGVNVAPLHLVRVDLGDGSVSLTEICGRPGGVVANPPLIDARRRIAVGFDSGNGVLVGFDIADDGTCTRRWEHDQAHASHLLLIADTGEFLSTDHDANRMMDALVVRDITTGAQRCRVDSGSLVQSVLFPACGWHDDVYYCSFAGIARLAAYGDAHG